VDPRAGLDDMEKQKFFILPGLELPPVAIPTELSGLLLLNKYIFIKSKTSDLQ
jgi:hypothetical protein